MLLDALFVHGRIRTLDPARPTASSVGVLGGRVVGFDADLHGCTARVRYDLGGAPVLPGFHDAHQHLSSRGQGLQGCDVSAVAAPDLDALYARLAAHAATLPPGAWVLAAGYDDARQGPPRREALDAACHGRPLWMVHCSHHGGMVNTEALRRMGYPDARDVPDVPGGVVGRRADGTPTGFLAERAVELVTRLVRPAPFEAFVAAIGLGSAAALADGLTSVTEPGVAGLLVGNGPADLAAFQTARDRGLLGVRMTVLPEVSALHDLAAGGSGAPDFGLDLGVRSGWGDDDLRLGGVKIFADGGLTTRTAALCNEYADRPGERGILDLEADGLRRTVLAAHRAGWQVATHAIGDAAVDAALDAYEHAQQVAPRPGVRHRMEHCGIATDAAIGRLARLGVVPVPQPRFLVEFGDAYLEAVGPGRGELLYRARAFLDAGLELAGSSDCPVADGSPLRGIQAHVTRTTVSGRVLAPAERLTVAQAVRAYTRGSAYADGQEHRKGTLARGMLADLVVLTDDVLTAAADAIGDIGVVATVVGGEVRHGGDALPEG